MLIVQAVLDAARLPYFKLISTGSLPELDFAKGHKWHLFLSHIWCTVGSSLTLSLSLSLTLTLTLTLNPALALTLTRGTGQDQCATIKRQLCLLLMGVSVFLDVDDLKDIGDLEEYVEQSAVIMIFVSKGYFKSLNCLREARGAVAKGKG